MVRYQAGRFKESQEKTIEGKKQAREGLRGELDKQVKERAMEEVDRGREERSREERVLNRVKEELRQEKALLKVKKELFKNDKAKR